MRPYQTLDIFIITVPLFMKKNIYTLISALWICLAPVLHAQAEFDLNIPGMEETAVEAPTATASTPPSGEVNLLGMVKAGGWSMWVLGSFSFGLMGLLIFCVIDLNKKKKFQDPELVEALKADMQAGNLEGSWQRVQTDTTCLGRIMLAGYNYLYDYGTETVGSEHHQDVMADAALKYNRGSVRLINYFSVLAQAAPMMGLLGTVSGMIGAFGKLSQGGTGDPSLFAGNISEALITTASGLLIALPAIFCYFFFRDRLQSMVAECEETAEELIGDLRRALLGSQNATAAASISIPQQAAPQQAAPQRAAMPLAPKRPMR
jgi:biopolymer transport protein ExbB